MFFISQRKTSLAVVFAIFTFPPVIASAAMAPHMSGTSGEGRRDAETTNRRVYKHVACTMGTDGKISIQLNATFNINNATSEGHTITSLGPLMRSWFISNVTTGWKKNPSKPLDLAAKSSDLSKFLGFPTTIKFGKVRSSDHKRCPI